MEIRTLVALAATMACAAVAAHATSNVQTARETQTAPPPAGLDDPTRGVPDSPIAGALSADDGALQIQLETSDPEPLQAGLFDLPFEIAR